MSRFRDRCPFAVECNVYLRPRTLEQALDALADQRASVLAGGTDFYPALGERWSSTPLVDITAISELKGIVRGQDCFRIGGLTTWSELITTPLPPAFDALKAAAREIGGVQIQNRGTVAGNLCNASPAADSVPPLLALDAQVELVSSGATRRVSLVDFIIGNRKTLRRADEILSCVVVPSTVEDARSAFLKLGARRYLVISIAMVAVVLAVDEHERVRDLRIAVGSCSARAQRLSELEQALIHAPARAGLGALVAAEHLSSLSPIDDVRAPATYRSHAALIMIRRAIELCIGCR
jgi:CO/xanthine dehydrogenase FAD-binding subunit